MSRRPLVLGFSIAVVLSAPLVSTGCLHASRAGRAGPEDEPRASRFDPTPLDPIRPRSPRRALGAGSDATPSTPTAPTAPTVLSMEDDGRQFDRRAFVAAYLASSPELGAAAARTSAARARIAGAGSVPNPELAVEAWNVPFRRPYALNDASMWMAIVRQPFEARGVRRARMAAASADADAELAAEAEGVLAAAIEGVAAHAELVVAQATVLARQAARDAMVRVAETTRSLVAGGRVSSREVFGVDAELARADAALVSALARERALRRGVNVRMGRAPEAPLEALVDAAGFTPDEADALRGRLEAHPALRTADARIAAADARTTEARHAARRPRMSAGTGVFVEPTMGVGYGLMVGLELPWIGGRMNGERRVAEADARLARAEREATLQRLAIDLELALAEFERTEAAIAAFDETTLPALERAAVATSSGIASGAVSIADVFLARVRVTEAVLERVELLGERLRAESTLHALVAVLRATDATDATDAPDSEGAP